MSDEPACSFCLKPKTEVLELIAGPSAFICNECVQMSVTLLITKHPEWRAQLDLNPYKEPE